jgi:hypothetical protein
VTQDNLPLDPFMSTPRAAPRMMKRGGLRVCARRAARGEANEIEGLRRIDSSIRRRFWTECPVDGAPRSRVRADYDTGARA